MIPIFNNLTSKSSVNRGPISVTAVTKTRVTGC
jgi:hypothetical protein